MIISNSIKDYSPENIEKFAKYVQEMNNIIIKTYEIFAKESSIPSPKNSNVIYFNPRIKADFEKLKTTSLEFHEALAIYLEWHAELLYITNENIGNYKNFHLQKHVDDIAIICRTFPELIKNMKN